VQWPFRKVVRRTWLRIALRLASDNVECVAIVDLILGHPPKRYIDLAAEQGACRKQAITPIIPGPVAGKVVLSVMAIFRQSNGLPPYHSMR